MKIKYAEEVDGVARQGAIKVVNYKKKLYDELDNRLDESIEFDDLEFICERPTNKTTANEVKIVYRCWY